jgi:hypothetical protein
VGGTCGEGTLSVVILSAMITIQDKQLKDTFCIVVNGVYLSFKNVEWS